MHRLKVRQGPNAETGKKTQVPTATQEAICNWHLLEKEKLVFSNRVSWGQLTILKGRSSAQ